MRPDWVRSEHSQHPDLPSRVSYLITTCWARQPPCEAPPPPSAGARHGPPGREGHPCPEGAERCGAVRGKGEERGNGRGGVG